MADEMRLCCTKGSVIDEKVEMNFKGETTEVGLYLAMARQAEEAGAVEVAAALTKIAWEEAHHAARFAELNGKISPSLKANLQMMVNGELGACQIKYDMAKKAKEAGLDYAHDFIHEASRDEQRHANILQGLLKRYDLAEKENNQ